ncbi:MAG: fimbrillin family protein [Parabacteroides sp.]|nr:fimbrillin family protein [Parabacteroides sp.]
MKQFIYTFLIAAFLLLANACTEATIFAGGGGDDGKGGAEEGEVPLSVKNLGLSVEVESRSIATGGPAADAGTNPNPLTKVGLCVTKKEESGAVGFYDSGNTSTQFVYNAAASPAAVWEPAAGQEALLLSSVKGTVYAYVPAEKSVSLSGTLNVPLMSNVEVLDQQEFKFTAPVAETTEATGSIEWDIDQDDYLYCKVPTEVDRWSPAVSLTMYHALAKVSFRVVEKEGGTAFAGCRVKKVVLKSSGGLKKSATATLNLSTGELGDTMVGTDELSFTAAGTGTDDMRVIGTGVSEPTDVAGVPIQAFGLVIPVTGVDVTLELTLEDDRVFTMSPAGDTDVPGAFSVNWEKGNNYIYNIGMSPRGIEIANVVVAGWNEGGTTEVPME